MYLQYRFKRRFAFGMKTNLVKYKTELLKLAQSVVDKVTDTSDGEFDSMTAELTADFE